MYDTIIIGAGLSGLAAGIRLAYYDKSVCILERHTTIGGLNSFYRLRNRNYDVGLHAVTNYAEQGSPSGPLKKLLRQLRMTWDDFDLSPQCGSKVVFPDCELKFNNDFELFRGEVHQAFPREAENFNRLVDFLLGFNELDLSQRAVSARKTVGEYLQDPLLIDMIFCPLMFYGSAIPDDMDLNQFVIMFKSIFLEGFGRPFKGVRLIMKNLVRKYKSLGGELKLRSGVNRVLVEEGRVVGVELDDGRQLMAKNVLSSAGIAETSRLTEPAAPWPEQPSAGDVSFTETIYVLDQTPKSMGHEETIVFFNNERRFHYRNPDEPCDLRSGIICSPNNFDYGESGELEEGILRLTALANHRYWLSISEQEYAASKVVWEEKVRMAAESHMPRLDGHIVDTDMFTPKTVRRFTGHINGCVYGAPVKQLQGTTPVKGLFLCGTDQGFLGIIGSMLSGITMANNHVLNPA